MGSVSFATTLRTARAQKIIDAIDAGSGPGVIKAYSGPRPATGAAITTQTLAGTMTCSDPSGTVSNGVVTLSAVTEDSIVDNTCYIRFLRFLDSTGAFVADLDVAEPDGTIRNSDGTVEKTDLAAPAIMATTHVFQGGALRITSATFTEGNT